MKATSAPLGATSSALLAAAIGLLSAGLAAAQEPTMCSQATDYATPTVVYPWTDKENPEPPPPQVVDSSRWEGGGMEPRQLLGDTTDYRFNHEPDCDLKYHPNVHLWFDVAAEQGLIFTVTGTAFQVWEAGLDPGSPRLARSLCHPVIGEWKKEQDHDFYLDRLSVPEGRSDVALLGSNSGIMGAIVMDIRDPDDPRPIYQDRYDDLNARALATARLDGRDLGIVRTDGQEVLLYDLDAALELSNPCLETTQTGGVHCGEVYVGRLTFGGLVVKANRIAAAGRFLLTSKSGSIRVWDLENPLAVSLAATGPDRSYLMIEGWLHEGVPHYAGVAWHYDGGSSNSRIDLWSIPCVGQSSCAPTLLAEVTLQPASLANRLTASIDDGHPYLYVGSDNVNQGGPQREFLWDVSDPRSPRDLTPQLHPDGYWGWYYEPNPTGFPEVAPMAAVVDDGHLYRAAHSVLDVHEILGDDPPEARFTVELDPVFLGDEVQLCSAYIRRPVQWSWDFDGDGYEDSAERHPVWTAPSVPGGQTITLSVSNDKGSDTASEIVNVLHPDDTPMDVLRFQTGLFCVFGLCDADAGQSVVFWQEFAGRPLAWDYDWDGDGTFEDANHSEPVLEHVYLYGGTYRPRVRARRNDDSDTRQLYEEILVEGPEPPSPDIFSDGFESGGVLGWSTGSS